MNFIFCAMKLRKFPDFLCIGAQRAGTTWLYRNLQNHPGIWLPPIKELHYFDGKKKGLPKGIFQKFFSNRWPHSRYRKMFLIRVKAKLQSCRLKDFLWDYQFFFKEQDDQWYASLFDFGRDKRTGEICPGYSVLDIEDVKHIYNLMPNAKIIFILRNPIERAWSQAIVELVRLKKRRMDSLSDKELVDCLNHPRILLRSDYVRTLKIWNKCYDERQFFITFFEDVVHRPRDLLLRIFEFLEVDVSEKYVTTISQERVNIGPKHNIPKKWAVYLSRMYYEQIKLINKALGSQSSAWLECAEELLGGTLK
jgi:hypothetical protein